MEGMITYIKKAEVNNLFGQLERLSTHDNAIKFMYMYSERKGELGNRIIIDHKFKNINTRKYITLVESYIRYPSGRESSGYAIKGMK